MIYHKNLPLVFWYFWSIWIKESTIKKRMFNPKGKCVLQRKVKWNSLSVTFLMQQNVWDLEENLYTFLKREKQIKTLL